MMIRVSRTAFALAFAALTLGACSGASTSTGIPAAPAGSSGSGAGPAATPTARAGGGGATAAPTATPAGGATASPTQGPSGTAIVSAPAGTVACLTTPAGTEYGVTTAAMTSCRGIPYAVPPLGSLRWQPPQPKPRWAGVLAATQYANHCPQSATYAGIASTTEDCLYLNVFTPAGVAPNAKLPVMFWIHGGGLTVGESDDYDPDLLISKNRVVVTINYRLGYLGFLATTGLDAENHLLANYGIMDQQLALKWVANNISAFGGNPSNVTLFGQSAGGASTMTHLLWPASAGLFSHAIIESGAYALITTIPLATAVTDGNTFATNVGCAASDTGCLRAVPVSKILAAPGLPGLGAIAGGLTVDGTIIPQTFYEAYAEQKYTHVPIIQNTQHDEFRLFTAEIFDLAGGPLTAAEYPVFIQQVLTAAGVGDFTTAVLEEYPLSNYASPDLAVSALLTDAAFATPAVLMDTFFSAGGPGTIYTSEFADESEASWELPPVSYPLASCHQAELAFFWQTANPNFVGFETQLTPAEHQLSATAVDYWTQFAQNGSPNSSAAPSWLPYIAGASNMNEFVPPGASTSTSFATFHNTTFWTTVFLSLAAGLPTLPLGESNPPNGRLPDVLDAALSVAHERQVRLHAQPAREWFP